MVEIFSGFFFSQNIFSQGYIKAEGIRKVDFLNSEKESKSSIVSNIKKALEQPVFRNILMSNFQ